MKPDFPHKTFADNRVMFCFLMAALAMDSV